MALIKSISGIRGTIGGKAGEALTPIDIVSLTAAYAEWLKSNTQKHKVVVGRDGRISGGIVLDLVASTLQAAGIDVVDLDLSTTPTVEVAVPMEGAGGGIIVTASHNPREWNALKLLSDRGEFISAQAGQRILKIAAKASVGFATVDQLGTRTRREDYLQKHVDAILALPLVDKEAIAQAGFTIAIDCVNSTGGMAVPLLLRALGVGNIVELHTEPTGEFAHNPEPLPQHLTELSAAATNHRAHLGIAVDPDVDRLALVCEDGSFFGEEYTLVAVADYVLQHRPGNTVSNLSSSRALRDVTEQHGGRHTASAVGEVHVVEKMREVQAVIGGEGNGGIIYPDLHYGRDALVGIALFLTHLAKSGKTCSQLRRQYPSYYISKNKIELQPGTDLDHVLRQVSRKYRHERVNAEDGVRIDFDEQKQWVHLRRSNTEPIIRIYAESGQQADADKLAETLMADIQLFLNEVVH